MSYSIEILVLDISSKTIVSDKVWAPVAKSNKPEHYYVRLTDILGITQKNA